ITELTGREFAIDGNSELSVSLRPRLLLRDVRMRNAKWSDPVDMLQVKEVTLQVALLPLLEKRLKILDLTVDGLNLVLDTDRQHRSNWNLGSGQAAAEPSAGEGTGLTMDVELQHILVQNSHLTYKGGPGRKPVLLGVEKLALERLPDGLTEWDLAAKLDDNPLTLKGTTTPLFAFLGGKPLNSHLTGTFGDAVLGLDGTVSLHDTLEDIDLEARLEMPDLETASRLADKELPDLGPVRLNAKLSDTKTGYRFDIGGNLADIALQLKGGIARSFDTRDMKVEYSIHAPDLKTASLLAATELPEVGPWKVAGKVAGSERTYLITLDGEIDSVKIGAEGAVGNTLDGKDIDLALMLQAPDLARIGKLGGTALPAVGPVALKTKLNDIEGGYKISGLEAKVAESDLSGDAAVRFEKKPMVLTADLQSRRLDLRPFLADETSAGETADSGSTPTESTPQNQPTPATEKGRVFPDTALPFEALQGIDADITYRAGEIDTGHEPLTDVALGLGLHDGKLLLKPIQAQYAKGTIDGDMSLDASTGSKGEIKLDLTVRKLLLGDIDALKGALSGGSTNADIHLTGAGKSVREIMAGLDGETVVDVGHATLSDDTLNLLGGDVFLKLLGALMPKGDNSSSATLECAVVKFDIVDGMATTSNGIVAKTGRMVIIGTGSIDLKSEQISLQIRSHGRSLSAVDTGDLAQVVGLGGTLADPKPMVDVEGLAKTGATIGAAVLTLGTSYLAQKALEKAMEDQNPCQTALNASGKAEKTTATATKPVTGRPEAKTAADKVPAKAAEVQASKASPVKKAEEKAKPAPSHPQSGADRKQGQREKDREEENQRFFPEYN
ncbi:MAG TPA: AsmA family protein, partial [Sedimenticola sp.]|nr:AsmA family protein [Sedimenticola sp.]